MKGVQRRPQEWGIFVAELSFLMEYAMSWSNSPQPKAATLRAVERCKFPADVSRSRPYQLIPNWFPTDFQLIRAGALPGCPCRLLANACLSLAHFFSLWLIFLEKLGRESYNNCIRLGLCDNSQMIPFLITGTDLYRRSLFFLSRQKHFPVFQKQS